MLYKNRPLSPHLQIYKWQLTSVLSILHRITGVVLSAGLGIITLWLMSLLNSNTFDLFQQIFTSLVGRLVLTAWIFCFFYHLLNGIRHLMWDIGKGFDLKTTYKTGWLVAIGAFFLTSCFVLFYIL